MAPEYTGNCMKDHNIPVTIWRPPKAEAAQRLRGRPKASMKIARAAATLAPLAEPKAESGEAVSFHCWGGRADPKSRSPLGFLQ